MKQRGFVLISMLIVVAVVAGIVAGLYWQQGVLFRRAQLLQAQTQALAVADGLIDWVKWGLDEDARHSAHDGLDELWARPMPPLPFAQGEVGGWLDDAQGRINVNNVADAAQGRFWAQVLTRLAQAQGVSISVAALQDWLDADAEPRSGGAETDDYAVLEPSYRPPDGRIITVQALAAVQGWSNQAVETLAPFLTALPTVTAVNVNTASATVLQALLPTLQGAALQAWLARRKTQPAHRKDDFYRFVAGQLNQPLESLKKALPEWAIIVKSEYFRLHGHLRYGDISQGIGALFQRTKGRTRVVMHWLEAAETQ